jgi:hypothetical protein
MPMVAFHPIHTPTYHYHYSSHNIHNIMLLSHFKQYPLCLPATLIYFIPSILPLISYKTRQLYLQAQTAHTRKSAPANSYSTIIKAYIPLQLNQATTKNTLSNYAIRPHHHHHRRRRRRRHAARPTPHQTVRLALRYHNVRTRQRDYV